MARVTCTPPVSPATAVSGTPTPAVEPIGARRSRLKVICLSGEAFGARIGREPLDGIEVCGRKTRGRGKVADGHGGVHDLVLVDMHEAQGLASVDTRELTCGCAEVHRVAGRCDDRHGDSGE